MTTTPVPARAILSDELAAKIRALGETHGVCNIRLFGSFARGDAGEHSDLDLLVDYLPGQRGFAFVEFCEGVEALVGRRVDVVTAKSLHPIIRDKVLAQAVPL